MITIEEPIKKGGIITVHKTGSINRHGPTPPRPYALKYEHGEGEERRRITFQTRTHLITPAAEYVRLAVRTMEPAHIHWEKGTEEVKAIYNQIDVAA